MKTKKTLEYFLIALFILVVVGALVFNRFGERLLGSVFLAMVQDVEDGVGLKRTPPDLGISEISFYKTANPDPQSNNYRYSSNIIIKNYGGAIRDAKVTLSAENKVSVLRNCEGGFCLEKDKTFEIKNFELRLNGNYNAGQLDISLQVEDGKGDQDLTNNKRTASFFETPAKINLFEIRELTKDNSFIFDYDYSELLKNDDHEVQIYTADDLGVSADQMNYSEKTMADKIYGYYKIRNSLDLIENEAWKHIGSNFYNISAGDYIYVAVKNKLSGDFAFSNILYLPEYAELSRAQMAKLLVDGLGISISDVDQSAFADVPKDSWYAPYVQVLFEMGVLDFNGSNYNPSLLASRGDVLKTLIEFYDVDLKINDGAPHFKDVPEDDEAFVYAETLFANNHAGVFEGELKLNQNATNKYINYLINAYTKNN